jgi:hypothetical protein
MYLTPPEAAHVRTLVLADLEEQRHIEVPVSENSKSVGRRLPSSHVPESEDDDIPF